MPFYFGDKMKKKLRLLLFKNCNRKCEGCCNKDWDLDSLPKARSFKKYYKILLTGGEPMLDPILVLNTIKKIKQQNPNCTIYLYTAKPNHHLKLILHFIDGVVVTLHEQADVEPFLDFHKNMCYISNKSYRLNIFKGIKIPKKHKLKTWKIKDNMEWIKDCPLPSNEEFKKL
jgi:hypothetical protein